jgi:hypothetical protein
LQRRRGEEVAQCEIYIETRRVGDAHDEFRKGTRAEVVRVGQASGRVCHSCKGGEEAGLF